MMNFLGGICTPRASCLCDGMLQAVTGSRKRHDLSPRVGRVFLAHSRLLAGAILFGPLSPFRDDPTTLLVGIPVLIIDGEKDTRHSPGGARLTERLRDAGAMVTHHVLPVGHSITDIDRRIAGEWLARLWGAWLRISQSVSGCCCRTLGLLLQNIGLSLWTADRAD
jgi:acetyl esterase/lipase